MESDLDRPDLKALYVNAARLNGSPFDVVLDLGTQHEADVDPAYAVRVLMSWPHAKSLQGMLTQLIQRFEETTGVPIYAPEPAIRQEPPDDAAN